MLRSRRVNRWPLVADNAALFRTRGTAFLRWVVALVWLFATTHVFQHRRADLGRRCSRSSGSGCGWARWTCRWETSSPSPSPSGLRSSSPGWWRSCLEEGLANKGLARGVPAAISRTASYAVVAVGTVLAFLASGMELTKFTVIVGTLGVGIGFGLQNVVNNFVSGLILLYERPVQVGDVIEVGKVTGTVRRIGIRSSTVATPQGAEVVVPNANLISNEVINWTLSDRRRRADIDVGVAYGTPPEKVRTLLLQVAGAHPEVMKLPEPHGPLHRLRRQRAELPAPGLDRGGHLGPGGERAADGDLPGPRGRRASPSPSPSGTCIWSRWMPRSPRRSGASEEPGPEEPADVRPGAPAIGVGIRPVVTWTTPRRRATSPRRIGAPRARSRAACAQTGSALASSSCFSAFSGSARVGSVCSTSSSTFSKYFSTTSPFSKLLSTLGSM